MAETTVGRRKSAYVAAGYDPDDAEVMARNPSIARQLMFPPTEVHAENRTFDQQHPLPARAPSGKSSGDATKRFMAGRITTLVQKYMAPKPGKYGTTIPGMAYADALAQAKSVVGGAMAAASEPDDDGGDTPARTPTAPVSSGDVDLRTPAPAASPAPATGVRVGPRAVRAAATPGPTSPASKAKPPARAPRPADAIAQDAYDMIASGKSSLESARQHLAAPVYQRLQGLLQARPLSAR